MERKLSVVFMALALKELKKIASMEGVPQGTTEKDYALSVALKIISKSRIANNLVFKGGTALRKAFYKGARYSEDLDFNVNKLGKLEILRELKQLLPGKEVEGITFGQIEHEETSAGLKVNIKFMGPLNHEQRMRFDFNFRDNAIKKPVKMEMIDSYKIGAHSISVLALEEILAEKIQALSSRATPRDLYGSWFLLKNKVRKDNELIRKKFGYYNEKLGKEKILQNIQGMEFKWKDDLGRLVKKLPAYNALAKEVVHFIQNNL